MRIPKRARGIRRLRLESLENRRMLMGDGYGAVAEQTDFSVSGVDLAASTQSVATAQSVAGANGEAASFQAADAGSSFASAADLGVVNGTLQRNGTLGLTDRVDTIRFEVQHDANVNLRLDQLARDADLYVRDARGNLLGSSTRSGQRAETLAGTLPAGEYFVSIVAQSWWSNRYRISLTVAPFTPVASPPAADSPSVPEPTPAPPAEPEQPTAVGPLADVGYFGGGNDWNLNAVEAPEAWAAGYTGQGITVAVIDTGIDLDHPDLVHNLYVNAGEIPGNGIDDDRNGFVDDVSGYDFVSGDARAEDGNGHGTHVAGTIAAANNGIGATGVAPDAKILPVRVLDDAGRGSDGSVAAGIRYAADMGAQIINLSLGGGYSSRILAAIEYAASAGSLIVAAAGNESASNPSYPARHSANSTSVISVGAHDSRGNTASFSNEVGSSRAVQVDAPGVSIYSTHLRGGYGRLSGTSMASPHVAGVAALTLSANPGLTSREVRDLLATGTVGRSAGSDAIGNVSASYSVAYAAAGLSSVGGSVAATVDATARRATTTVRANVGMPAASAFLPVAAKSELGDGSEFDSSEHDLIGPDPSDLVSTDHPQLTDHSDSTDQNQWEPTDQVDADQSDSTDEIWTHLEELLSLE